MLLEYAKVGRYIARHCGEGILLQDGLPHTLKLSSTNGRRILSSRWVSPTKLDIELVDNGGALSAELLNGGDGLLGGYGDAFG